MMIHGECRRNLLWLLAGMLFLTGCATEGGSSQASTGLPLGTRIALPEDSKALGDVVCEFYKAGDNRDLEKFEIRCPGWEQYTGLVWRGDFPRPSAGWEETLLKESDLAATIQTKADCEAPESTQILNEQPAWVRRCTSFNGGFPYLFIASGINNRAFVLWGPAHLAPLFEDFIEASLQGTAQQTLPGTRSQLIVLAEQEVTQEGRFIGLEDMGQFIALDALSSLYNSAKNHQRALETAQHALEIHERIRGTNHPASGYLIGRIARELSRLQPEAAEAMFRRGEPLVQASSDPSDLPEFLVYRAWHELSQGDYGLAEQDAQRSWDLSQKVAARSRQGAMNPRIAHSLIGVGDIYVSLDNLEQAETAYRQALEIFDSVRGGDYHWVGESHLRLAEVYRRRKDYELAQTHAQAAIDLERSLFGEGRALADALMTLANIEQEAGQTGRALELWRETREILLTDRAAQEQLRAEDVEGYLALLFERADSGQEADKTQLLDEAFQVSQLAQTPLAGRAITQLAARLAEEDPAVRETVRALQDASKTLRDTQYRLGLEQSKPYLERDSEKEEALKARLRQASQEHQQLEERLQAQFPRYGRLVTPTPLSLAQVTASLRPGEALLRILPGKAASWVFLVKSDGRLYGAAAKVSTRQLTAQVERLRAGVDVSSGTLPDFDLMLAHDLYRQLLGPLESALAGVDHLIVVPSGPLLSLPPALLVRQAPRIPNDYQGASWLVRDMALSVLPSVVALEQFRQVAAASQASLPFIGFGDPVFSNQSGHVRGLRGLDQVMENCQIDAASVSRLPQLPETAGELRTVARTLGADVNGAVLLGKEASISAVQNKNLQNYRIIAFATHALLPGELNCLTEPALALTPQTGEDKDNGLLDATDIANLKLDAEWVLLSACNTAGAGGGRLRGEGLSGLATAFFYAGARTLLASHWYVVSEPTVELTTSTFEAYRKAPQQGRAQALRQAQLKLLNNPNTSHPVFWAAFTLIGESNRL